MRSTFSLRSAILILLLGVCTYLYGLDSRFAPKNGDEYPYMHIVRMTADAGHWLPLQSEMVGLKNTKPPLIFWQGIASSSWGSDWTLAQLRWPSVLYTGLTAFFLFLALWRFSGRLQTGLLAGLIWLSFFATYRYGRPFLTDPPEVFWLSLPFFALLYWGRAVFQSKLLFPILAGICFGLALLAKSFAYIVPALLALGLFYWRWREWRLTSILVKDLYKLILIGVLALGIFSLWFFLDPFPEAVWREFVLGENAGKFEARHSNYFLDLISGSDSIWMLLLTSLANAGLFFFVLISTLMQCWRERRFLSVEELLLFLWVAAFLLIFSLPSQRSGRYLLPVMPAFAAMIALHWERLPLWGFRIALALQLILLGALSWASANLQLSPFLGTAGVWAYSNWHWLLLSGALTLVLVGLFQRRYTKSISLAACFLCYCALTSSLSPLEGALGRYSSEAIQQVSGQDIWIPCDYRAKDEEYRLLLPSARLHGYPAQEADQVSALTQAYSIVAIQTPMGTQPELCASCVILGQRMEMRARQSSAEIKAILLGEIGKYLFVNEYIIANPAATLVRASEKDACR
ncbi:4-amino-4-deoxy-L-arabinose transferase [Polynucleobacter meluiroseus]|uniref:4-amino-4-deoxy-L-arabinose transferase n=1 Tax=Polynucleobacter meluiroseus TaxID=1938814 RepID=A0A240E1K9_9BURK|nr:phospholipid carrier-dependent glycosyltransferase [Polynucleobacter meluiroseus]SNX29328.1 4-amino-4-deoxy-L-arabinose transferase [Polynucleobacter meluiroseus]